MQLDSSDSKMERTWLSINKSKEIERHDYSNQVASITAIQHLYSTSPYMYFILYYFNLHYITLHYFKPTLLVIIKLQICRVLKNQKDFIISPQLILQKETTLHSIISHRRYDIYLKSSLLSWGIVTSARMRILAD